MNGNVGDSPRDEYDFSDGHRGRHHGAYRQGTDARPPDLEVSEGLPMKQINAGDPETRSVEIVADNLRRLKVMFPEAFTERKVDFDALLQLLGDGVDQGQEKYGLNWHGKRRAGQLALTPSTGTLRPCPEESVDWDSTQNLMIEGDN